MKILVTGGTGQVGSYLAEELASVAEVYAPSRLEMDLRSVGSLREVTERFRPDWIFHAAAYTAVDRAEADREACFAINVDATRTLAEQARALDATLVTFSSDYVFDGSADRAYVEEDATGPINVYGESKLLAERALHDAGSRFLNFRTSWVYSVRGNNFVKTMLRLAGSRPELKVVADQRGCPTSAYELARATAKLVHRSKGEIAEKSGTYHLAGQGDTTWHEFAREVILEAQALKPEQDWTLPEPVPSAAYVTAARRPQNSRLGCDRANRELGLVLPDWRESTRAVIGELLGQS